MFYGGGQRGPYRLQAVRQTPNQVLKSYSFDLNDPSSSKAALDAACHPHGGRSPDAMFLCAGKSTPGFFVEEDDDSLRQGMDNGYWVQAWSALVSSADLNRWSLKLTHSLRQVRSAW